jgi:ATP-dependent exoDNAse (exonuclease V) beta subunit
MTIHKSKGLEFPVVIFPFANSNIFEEINPKLWLPVNSEDYLGFAEVLINKKQDVKDYSETAALLYEQDHEKIQLDAFNLLYVVLTRAVSSLFIISAKALDRNGEHNTNYYSGLFINYLKERGIWEEEKFDYGFGSWTLGQQNTTSYQNDIPYIYTNKDRPDFKIVAKAGMLWDQGLDIAVNQGNVIHSILGNIQTTADLDHAVETAYQKGLLKELEIAQIKRTVEQVINHPEIKQFYGENVEVLNERDILMANGTTQRPDRVTITNNRATIIDYKTGDKHKSHENQVNTYAQSFLDMGYAIDHKIIVYINSEIQIQFI